MKSCLPMFRLFTVCLLLAPLSARAQETLPQDRTAAVIFAYQMVGEDQSPAMNIRIEQFQSHIRELLDGGYRVAPLPEIIEALKNGASVPPHTVVLTFDGGHKSVLKNAVPLLLANNLPFTLFVSTDYLDRESDEYIGWADLKKLARNRQVTIGLHPAAYTHMGGSTPEEIKRQINNARARMRDMLGEESALFAYPFGEYNTAFRDIVAASGFSAAFGQQSGVAYAGEDIFSLPRFTMTESFGDLDRFHLTASALPLPVTDAQPRDPRLDNRNPVIGFTVDKALQGALKNMSCFASGQEEKPHMELVGGGRVELRLKDAFEEDRARLNCTLPGPPGEADDLPRWRWFGMLMTVPAGSEPPKQPESPENQ
ncbi:MAG TPA: polysaccharide deacetylase family protein [Alphaproteobacteria bacterium]